MIHGPMGELFVRNFTFRGYTLPMALWENFSPEIYFSGYPLPMALWENFSPEISLIGGTRSPWPYDWIRITGCDTPLPDPASRA